MADSDNKGDQRDVTGTEDWIFGDDPRAMKGYLRSLDAARDKKIGNNGHGIRVYPETERRGLAYIVDSERGTCSGDNCRSIETACVHLWEDRFRFGMYAGRQFVPPAHRVQIHEKGTGKYVGVRRHRQRPNPDIGGKRFATRMKHARIAIPTEYKERLREVLAIVRSENEREPLSRGRGRPAADIIDTAFVAVARIVESLAYEELDAKIKELFDAGFISTKFKWPRVVEAMNDPRLGELLDRVVPKLMRPFRKVTETLVLDGVVFSTARTDNARKSRYTSEGPVQLTLHALYEYRWGFLTAFRLTWHQRGRGSGESPQFPYLAAKAREILDYEVILADTAFHSRRNFEFANAHGFKLISKPKRTSERTVNSGTSSTQNERFGMAEDDPLLKQTFVFRNRVEGWHDVFRETTEPYLISRPDRSNYPAQTQKEKRIAEMMKEKPDLAEAELPEDQEAREAIIRTEQFVGVSPNNEMRCRQVNTFLRAIVKAEHYYDDKVNFAADRAFRPRQEDDAFSIYRALTQRESA